jgi:hypothetical protein
VRLLALQLAHSGETGSSTQYAARRRMDINLAADDRTILWFGVEIEAPTWRLEAAPQPSA